MQSLHDIFKYIIVRPSSSTSPPKKSWWLIRPFTKKRSSQNTRTQLECDSTVDNVSSADDDALTIQVIESTEPFLFTSPTLSITVLNEVGVVILMHIHMYVPIAAA